MRASQFFPLAALTFLPLSASSQSPCTATSSYSPLNPILGQPITLSMTLTDFASPRNNQFGETVLVVFSADTAGGGAFNNGFDEEHYISSTPSTFTFTFTPKEAGAVTATAGFNAVTSFPDCLTGGTPPLQFDVAPVGQSGANGNLLNGQYLFHLEGSNPQVQGAARTLDLIGSLTADGQGNITAGIADLNSGAGSSQAVPLQGAYTIDSAGHGVLNLKSTVGPLTLDFSVPPTQLLPTVEFASLIARDGYVVFGSGDMVKQKPVSIAGIYSYPLKGTFSVDLAGDSPCTTTCVAGAPIYENGLLTLSSSLSGTLEASAGTVLIPSTAVTGGFSGADATTGRFTFTVSQGQLPDVNFVGYASDASHFRIMSVDSHATTYLLAGSASQ